MSSPLNPIFASLVRGTIVIQWQVVTTSGNVITFSPVFYVESPNKFYILLIDTSSNQYTTSEVKAIVQNGSLVQTVLSIPASYTKKASNTLLLNIEVTITTQPWDTNLVQDLLYALTGQLYQWDVQLTGFVFTFQVLAQTTTVGTTKKTTYYCATTKIASQGTFSVTFSVATTTPSTLLTASYTLSQCQKLKTTTLQISDSLGNYNTTAVSTFVTSTCPYGKSCPTTFIIYFS